MLHRAQHLELVGLPVMDWHDEIFCRSLIALSFTEFTFTSSHSTAQLPIEAILSCLARYITAMAPRPSLPTSHKKRKADTKSDKTDAFSIQKLEEQIATAATSQGSLNSLADLLDSARETTDPSLLTKSIYALYRSFVIIITNGLLSSTPANEEARVVRTWVNERLHEYTEFLVGLMKDEDPTIRVS